MKENPWLLTTNGSTHYANLLVIVASHVSLAITSPWFKSFTKHGSYVTHHIQTQQNNSSCT